MKSFQITDSILHNKKTYRKQVYTASI